MEMNPKSELAKRVFEYLIENPMSLLKFAKLVGISHTAILHLMRGGGVQSPIVRFKIEKFMRDNDKNKSKAD